MRPSVFRTFLIAALAIALLALIDSVLANTEKRETALEAARSYREGQRLMQERQYKAAADAFRSAIANARSNPEYPLALGQALLEAGSLAEATNTLTDLLAADSMAGAPNLAMARVLAKEGQLDNAAFYYHRAIYGQWKGDAAENQLNARFELVDFLAARNSKAELLAELLPLQDQAAKDNATQMKLAHLFLTAGSPTRAAAIFHDLARAYPKDPAAYQGIGEAEFARGNYTEAQRGFIEALRLNPDDRTARKQLALCDQVLNLDPMRRGLAATERYDRSVHVLQLVVDKLTPCAAPADMEPANAALKRKVPASAQSDAVEANLDLANKLWRAGQTNCPSAISGSDEPLQLLLAKPAP